MGGVGRALRGTGRCGLGVLVTGLRRAQERRGGRSEWGIQRAAIPRAGAGQATSGVPWSKLQDEPMSEEYRKFDAAKRLMTEEDGGGFSELLRMSTLGMEPRSAPPSSTSLELKSYIPSPATPGSTVATSARRGQRATTHPHGTAEGHLRLGAEVAPCSYG